MQAKEIYPNIYLLEFEDQVSLMTTFCRFQEHYESPKFRGKIFSLSEFKEWYANTYGGWTYYTDWNGCNIPSYVLTPFIQGKFDPLTKQEKQIVDMFKDREDGFYVIGIHKKHDALIHETAHGLFFTNDSYRERVSEILHEFDTSAFRSALLKGGYCDEVLDDEVHAYAISGSKKYDAHMPCELKIRLKEVFEEFTNTPSL